MEYALERLADGEWCRWGVYDIDDERDLNAMLRAALEFGRQDVDDVRLVKENE